jgi:hypothetical protein
LKKSKHIYADELKEPSRRHHHIEERNREYLERKKAKQSGTDCKIYKDFWRDFSKLIEKEKYNKAEQLLTVYYEVM